MPHVAPETTVLTSTTPASAPLSDSSTRKVATAGSPLLLIGPGDTALLAEEDPDQCSIGTGKGGAWIAARARARARRVGGCAEVRHEESENRRE